LASKSQSSPDRGTRRRTIGLENALAELDKYHLLVLDDIVYVSKDQAETSVLFELIASRYERRFIPITANQPFGDWGEDLSRSSYDAGRYRPSRSSLDYLRDERRKLSPSRCPRPQAQSGPSAYLRDKQGKRR
jgi:hypothetical protein